MVQRFTSDGLSSRSFHQSTGSTIYIVLLVASKVLKAFGLFIAYDLLKLIPIVVFLFLLKAGTSVLLVVLQKPFSSGPKLSKHQWFRIWRHAVLGTGIGFLWIFGLAQCGPLRTILLFEHADVVVIAGASALFSSNGAGGPAKARGAIIFIVAVISLLVFDHDEKLNHLGETDNTGENIHHTIFTHFFKHGVDFLGWSDHKGGVVLLFLSLCLHTGYSSAAKKLSVEVGGAKRLHSLSTLVSAGVLFPWACFVYITTESVVDSWLLIIFPLLLVVFFIGVFDFYIEGLSASHLQPVRAAFLAAATIFGTAIFLSVTWTHPYITRVTTMNKLNDIVTEDHVLSGGVVFSVAAFLLATHMLMTRGRAAKGSFIGYNPAGLPLYSISSEALQKTSQSILSVLKSGLRQILEDGDSRKIFYFLTINLCFTFVELLYGVWTNSLGLISDGFHMLFDCSALVMGLYASIMVRFDRVEVLSGFVNGLLLVVIAVFVFAEAIARLFEPPEVKTERLLTVSVLGLLVNLIGIFAFKSSLHGHSHGGGHGHSHGGGHGHSHGGGHGHSHGGGHGHSHGGGHGHSHESGSQEMCTSGGSHGQAHHNTNMEGVFLHVVADTMGSVGVIVSTLLIENFGWNIADPICSIFIATMIFLSVIPLLKETVIILLLRSPLGYDEALSAALEKILTIEGVLSYRDPHFWSHTATKVYGMIHVQAWPLAQEQRIIAQVSSVFKEAGISSVTVQVEKQSYFFHLSGLGATPVNISQFLQQPAPTSIDPQSVKAV